MILPISFVVVHVFFTCAFPCRFLFSPFFALAVKILFINSLFLWLSNDSSQGVWSTLLFRCICCFFLWRVVISSSDMSFQIFLSSASTSNGRFHFSNSAITCFCVSSQHRFLPVSWKSSFVVFSVICISFGSHSFSKIWLSLCSIFHAL